MCSLEGNMLKGSVVAYRYGFDASGKLPAQPSVQAQALVGIFNNRASNPVVQAAAADSTEAILWEVSLPVHTRKSLPVQAGLREVSKAHRNSQRPRVRGPCMACCNLILVARECSFRHFTTSEYRC